MITLDKITKKIGARTLFEDVSAIFSDGNRYGLTGPNGAGKSTLLKIMMGIEEATSGHVKLPQRVGFLKQNISEYKEETVLNVVIKGNERLAKALEEQERLYTEEYTDDVGIRLGELGEIIGDEDGYSADSNAQMLLHGVGIPKESYDLPLGEIPAGDQFKVMLCQALFGNPEALLLDEPTNHLDLDSIHWLEGFLKRYVGILIVVSHDRHFLNSVTTHIADIDYDTIIIYPGNYDEMVITKSNVRARADAETKSREKKISQLKEFVAKFGAGTRASQVQSRMKEIDKLQPDERKKTNIQRPYIVFDEAEKQPGRTIMQVKDISFAYGDNQVIKNFSIEISRGDKIGIIGNNGLGKTTLLRLLSGELTPDSGEIDLGHNIEIDYFPQNHGELVDKSAQLTAFDWVKEQKLGLFDQDVRAAMGKMLFSGDDAFKSSATLSGGETARLILSAMMLRHLNTMLLDEPNNHLDLEAVSALGISLEECKATVLVASHDRDLIGRAANRIIHFQDEGITVYDGPLEEYLPTRN